MVVDVGKSSISGYFSFANSTQAEHSDEYKGNPLPASLLARSSLLLIRVIASKATAVSTTTSAPKSSKAETILPAASSPRLSPNFSPIATRTAGEICTATKVLCLLAVNIFQAFSNATFSQIQVSMHSIIVASFDAQGLLCALVSLL